MELTREVTDTLQICQNGHEITHFYNNSPNSRRKFCPICGKTTIHSCEKCGEPITGGTVIYSILPLSSSAEVSGYSPGIRPEYCEHCGIPFPWTSQQTGILPPTSEGNIETSTNENNIFIVHGHNPEVKNQVEECVQQIGLSPIILHKQPNLGKTLIEKVEHYAEPVQFAIIILTGDDFGGSFDAQVSFFSKKKEEIFKPRARQNVIFEFGYFIGRLGRMRVAAIYEEGVELPSDIDGLVYIKYDSEGDWKNDLNRELLAAGVELPIKD